MLGFSTIEPIRRQVRSGFKDMVGLDRFCDNTLFLTTHKKRPVGKAEGKIWKTNEFSSGM
jgi:hypothetical protein